jgi:predicted naringenin-chalcone synthase
MPRTLRTEVRARPRRPLERAAVPAAIGWGTSLPDHVYRQDELARYLGRALDERGARRLRAAFRAAKVETRCSVLPDFAAGAAPRLFDGSEPSTAARLRVFREEAPRLSSAAAKEALRSSGVAPSRVTHFLFVTCTGFAAPGPDQAVAHEVGLPRTVHRVQIGFQGCSAGVVALRTAAEMVRGDRSAVVLVVSCEISSIHFQNHWKSEDLRGHALFADGAGACVVADEGASTSPARPLLLGRGASLLLPDSEGEMTWDVEDTGFRMRLGAQVPDALATALPGLVRELGGAAVFRHWAVHPGGPAIVDRVGECLRLAPDRLAVSRDVLRSAGNVSSATIFFVLQRVARDDTPGEGLALAFGPGLTAEALRFSVPGER